jgi:hypothetical protein
LTFAALSLAAPRAAGAFPTRDMVAVAPDVL